MSKEAHMNGIRQFFYKSIVNKVILLVSLILISVAGILTVTTISFFNVKNSMVSMIDRDVGRVIENIQMKNHLSKSLI